MATRLGYWQSTAIVAAAALCGCARPNPDLGSLAADEIDYNWHVRPILSENCFKCHGPDPSSREAGLRLDIGELAVQELPETPGKLRDRARRSESQRARAPHPLDRCRRTHAAGVDAQNALGAADGDPRAVDRERRRVSAALGVHRARASRPSPETALAQHAANDIDRFVLGRLEREGLEPSAPADKETLISRVTLTLTGLPPTLEEIDAFVADTAPDAYERLVDRLLASPAYAEHMADYWLDLARFSETDGFLDDHHDRLLWPWRDWVIESFARNRPFDEFGTWQLAGDLLPDATREQILATAFLRVGKRTTENGAIDAEYKAEYMVERTDNALGVAFLGLTVGCARCHDHKYDPIKQTDYYSLGAFFNSNDEPGAYAPGFSGIQGGPTLPWPDDATAAALREAAAELTAKSADYAAAQTAATEAARAAAALAGRRSGRRRSAHPRDARRRARRALRIRVRAAGAARGSAAATHAAHSAAGADRVPAQSVLRTAAHHRTRRPSNAGSAKAPSSRSACRATTTPSR